MPVVAAAAAAWGLDGLLREPLATAINPVTVVVWEHLLAVCCLIPVVPAAVRAFRGCSVSQRTSIVVIGAGSSALATILFTKAFQLSGAAGDFVSPLVLQKLQPVFAVVLAVALLRERIRPVFACYAVPAMVGAWLLAFPRPLSISVTQVEVAACAVGAAVLWAAGTVLGRLVAPAVAPGDVTTLRYCFGLVAAVAVCAGLHAPSTPGLSNLPALALLALIPGLAALRVYYAGLRHTPASRATFAELAFPVTAAAVGVLFLGTSLSMSQWLGMAVVVSCVAGLALNEGQVSVATLSTA